VVKPLDVSLKVTRVTVEKNLILLAALVEGGVMDLNSSKGTDKAGHADIVQVPDRKQVVDSNSMGDKVAMLLDELLLIMMQIGEVGDSVDADGLYLDHQQRDLHADLGLRSDQYHGGDLLV
jgi:hypothetical protein